MSRETVMKPYLDLLTSAIAAGERVNGKQILTHLQRDISRDAAEQVFMLACTNPAATPEHTQAATTKAIWVLTTAMGDTCRFFGFPDDLSQELAAVAVSNFHDRLGDLCRSAQLTETRQ